MSLVRSQMRLILCDARHLVSSCFLRLDFRLRLRVFDFTYLNICTILDTVCRVCTLQSTAVLATPSDYKQSQRRKRLAPGPQPQGVWRRDWGSGGVSCLCLGRTEKLLTPEPNSDQMRMEPSPTRTPSPHRSTLTVYPFYSRFTPNVCPGARSLLPVLLLPYLHLNLTPTLFYALWLPYGATMNEGTSSPTCTHMTMCGGREKPHAGDRITRARLPENEEARGCAPSH
jgi:hypothetical protein